MMLMVVARVLMVVSRVLMLVARVVLVVVMWFLTGCVKRNSPLSLCDILAVADMEHVLLMVVAKVLMVVARVLMVVARVLLVVVMFF